VVKTISRTLDPARGEIKVDGRNGKIIAPGEYARKLAAMSQHQSNIEGLKVYDRVAYGRVPHAGLFGMLKKKDHDLIRESMEETDVWHLRDRELSKLSGGELQRVCLAACFAQEPEVLILDEPTNHLDIKHQHRILSLVKRRTRKNGLTVLCVLHDINQTIRYADRIGIMKSGTLRAEGIPGEVINEKNIREIYDMNSRIHRSQDSCFVEFTELSE
ncbi:MAG: ABC transporter ATP-binding protein, partial [Spirochaetales bacterium]|nr:ABC transporter ATP-binding protein [Spirochaetales bacterium]